MELTNLGGRMRTLFSSENRLRIIVGLGLLGMLLILLSQFLGGSAKEPREVDAATADFVSEQYIAGLESKLTTLVSGMEGVGRAQVMVTLENGVEYVYAQDEKRGTDVTREEGAAEVSGRVYEKENVEQKYLLVDKDGRKQPLLRTELQPRVKGVVVVCEGADNIKVEQNLINVVTTALNIPSSRVCVVKIELNDSLREEAQ